MAQPAQARHTGAVWVFPRGSLLLCTTRLALLMCHASTKGRIPKGLVSRNGPTRWGRAIPAQNARFTLRKFMLARRECTRVTSSSYTPTVRSRIPILSAPPLSRRHTDRHRRVQSAGSSCIPALSTPALSTRRGDHHWTNRVEASTVQGKRGSSHRELARCALSQAAACSRILSIKANSLRGLVATPVQSAGPTLCQMTCGRMITPTRVRCQPIVLTPSVCSPGVVRGPAQSGHHPA